MKNNNIYLQKDGRFEGRIQVGRDESGKRKYTSFLGRTRDLRYSSYVRNK